MVTEVERLLVRLEVTQRKFEKQLAQAASTANKRSRQIERRFLASNKRIEQSFQRIGRTAGGVFGTVSRLALAAAAALGVRSVVRYGDSWTEVGNKIRSAEKISGTQARTLSQLNDIANRGRAGLEETADLYARLLRVSGQLGASEEQVARATEIVAKSFKAGGAAASEQAAGILQLSQALGSGVLAGDELRSLRENAPLLAQAIADEFETTVGGLKKLGAEGELEAGRVFQAILKAQQDIEGAFAQTVPTVSDGFTALKNGAMEFVGAFNEGSGASDGLANSLSNLGGWLSDNADAAQRFGAQIAEAFNVLGEAFEGMAGESDFGEIVANAKDMAGNVIGVFVDVAQAVTSTVTGVAAAAKQAFINAIAAVGEGGAAIANTTITVIEKILQGILNGVQKVINGINAVIRTANELPGVNLPTFGDLAKVSLGRVDASSIRAQVKPIGDAFTEAAQQSSQAWQDWENSVIGAARRVQRAGEKPFETNDPRGNQLDPPSAPGPSQGNALNPPSGTSSGGSGRKPKGGSGRRGRGGAGGASRPGLFETINQQKIDLERQIEALGLTKAEVAELTAKYALLDEAKKRGLDLDKTQIATGETLREEIDRQAAAIGSLTEKYEIAKEQSEFLEQQNKKLKDGFIDAIVEGENLAGVLADIAKELAKALFQSALFNEGPFAQAGGGSGILGGVLGGLFGGFRAGGGPVEAGKSYIVGEKRAEVFTPKTDGYITPSVPQFKQVTQQVMAAPMSAPAPVVNVPQQASPQVIVIDDPARIGDYLRSTDGERTFVELARRTGM